MRHATCVSALIAASLPLAACASSDARYPSLSVRAVERMTGTIDASAPPAAPAPMAEGTLGRLGDLEASAKAAHTRFVAQAPGARSAVAAGAGGSPGDKGWGAAQVALADLEAIRSETAIALGDLDLLFAEATLAQTDRAAINRTRTTILALVGEEDRLIAELRGKFQP